MKQVAIWFCLMGVTVITMMIDFNNGLWLLLKYLALPAWIFFTAFCGCRMLSLPHCKHTGIALLCQGIALVLMSGYVILSLDTFVFHVWDWFPGLLRYPIYDAYGLAYLIFALPAILWQFGMKQKEDVDA